ncbi:hypothetical protein HOU03_gp447 [Caulobacter phage CcrSC]|uniref:Uncharacterized protein n=1 Tax=Caulobacter phage CcrSC TaxID=2283272 RepID=A0A385ED80_9CAUD|nr:hypothetical protein HOU03_gp447 [Caulobacter phage CcrSC]AXQ69821.1 hypothetical protein CcrSC_gp239c [Caulobacter phage CcrSC]
MPATANVKTLHPNAPAPRQKLADLLAAAKAESRQQVQDYVDQVEGLIAASKELAAQGDMIPPGIVDAAQRLERVLDSAKTNIQSLAMKNL